MDDRDINLVELALATNIPKGCAETMVRGMTADMLVIEMRLTDLLDTNPPPANQ